MMIGYDDPDPDSDDSLIGRHLPGCPAAFNDDGRCRCDDVDEYEKSPDRSDCLGDPPY